VPSARTRRLAAALLLLGSAPGCSGGTDERPDVLLVTIDTLRADRLGSYGAPSGASPRLDALADRSVVFDRAIAGAAMTAPSHASIMTSRYTREHSVGFENGFSRLEGTPTLAEHFRDAGYQTAGFVGNINLTSLLGFDRGFDLFDDELVEQEADRDDIFERSAEATTRRALDWLSTTGPGPVLLWVHYQDPHGPYAPPGTHAGRTPVVGGGSERPLPFLADNSGRGGVPVYQQIEGVSRHSEYAARYADEVLYADEWVGRMIDAFDARSPDRDGVVLVTSDHGEAMGEGNHYYVHGTNTLPHLARVPMLLRAPGIAPGRRPEVVSHVDVLPTLLELAGVAAAGPMSGVALGPVLRDEHPLPERRVYCDNGAEVSVYEQNGFQKVMHAGRAYRNPETAAKNRPRWRSFTWDGAGRWSPTERASLSSLPSPSSLPEDVQAYIDSAVPMVLRPVEAPHLERLRALGYLD
jgi:arylsulfatase